MPMQRKRPLADPNQYYAYVWTFAGEVIWVGMGKNNRCRPECKASWGGRPKSLLELLETRRSEIEYEVFAQSSKEDAIILEAKLIGELKPKYNTAPGHGGYKGMHSQVGLNNLRQAQLGSVKSEEFKQAVSKRMVGNQLAKGLVHSQETKDKISQANKGKEVSELTKQKARERMIERNKNNPPRKGVKLSDEQRLKLSIAAKQRRKKN